MADLRFPARGILSPRSDRDDLELPLRELNRLADPLSEERRGELRLVRVHPVLGARTPRSEDRYGALAAARALPQNHTGADAHLGGVDPRGVERPGARKLVGQRRDPRREVLVLLPRGVVLEVLREVAVLLRR